MGLIEVVALIAAGIAAATALCWIAVGVAVRRLRQDKDRHDGQMRPGRV